ncbi:hypothetical protein [Bythopirellula polymerisocia]|uniref:Uncharacterized protein n=1 Tax=Bythopirellula polymerisocia TaxID=2528003 RepID=A0A5C6D260_9BACT|nr:hypothetical protein [Bythopirellula polymerisocia]TWU30215.1 hypothetical protein Pla144_10010 [Bythopirellula polymerisocia]
MNDVARKQLGWPAAATLIAALVSASLALALAQAQQEPTAESQFASAREIGEVKAGLKALERTTEQLRTDIRELRELVGRLINER